MAAKAGVTAKNGAAARIDSGTVNSIAKFVDATNDVGSPAMFGEFWPGGREYGQVFEQREQKRNSQDRLAALKQVLFKVATGAG